MTIRTRLTLWYSGLLTLTLVVFGFALIAVLNWAWIEQTQASLMKVATQAVEQIELTGEGRLRVRRLPDMTESVGYATFFVQIWDADGRIVDKTNPNFTQPLDKDALRSPERRWSDVMINDKHFYVLTNPIYTSDGERPGSIQVGTRLDQIDAATNRLIRIMIGIGAVAIILSLLIGSVIAGRTLQPIDTIAQAAARITAADDLSRRIPYNGPNDELGMLTVTFNATLERLERLFKSQRRFVADVSHELRTPLTTLQGNLDLIRRFGTDEQAMDAMRSEISRMTRLVSDLLLLARADSGNLPMKKELIDLDTQVLEVYREGRILGPQHEIRIEKIVPARVNADPDRIKQLLLNLVTNAIKYTPTGGTVTLTMEVRNGYAFVSVTDTGIGIPKADLEMIFERFYRVDKARSREAGGTGLGLSIAQWIAKSHGGAITAESTEGKGSTFTLQLPVLDTDTPPESMIQTRARIPTINRGKRATQSVPSIKD
jgi:two-component system, OmpR family, sensor kinase